MHFPRLKSLLTLVICSLFVLSFPENVNCANNKKASPSVNSAPAAPVEPEAVIEEVTAKQLEKLLNDKDYVAVFWCKYPPNPSNPITHPPFIHSLINLTNLKLYIDFPNERKVVCLLLFVLLSYAFRMVFCSEHVHHHTTSQ